MKILPILLFGLALLFQSCDTYVRVVSLKSDGPETDTMKLLYANDSFSIQYDFYGNGPDMKMQIFNKLDKPLILDLSQSSYIEGNQSFSYSINTEVYRTDSLSYRLRTNSAVVNIPPHTFVQKDVRIYLPVNFVKLPMATSYTQTTKNAYWGTETVVDIRETDYDKKNSPFKFQNYLTLSYDPSLNTRFYVKQPFWVSSVRDMKTKEFLGIYEDPSTGVSKMTNPFRSTNCFYIIYNPNQ